MIFGKIVNTLCVVLYLIKYALDMSQTNVHFINSFKVLVGWVFLMAQMLKVWLKVSQLKKGFEFLLFMTRTDSSKAS